MVHHLLDPGPFPTGWSPRPRCPPRSAMGISRIFEHRRAGCACDFGTTTIGRLPWACGRWQYGDVSPAEGARDLHIRHGRKSIRTPDPNDLAQRVTGEVGREHPHDPWRLGSATWGRIPRCSMGDARM